MFSRILVLLAVTCMFTASGMAADQVHQSQLNPAKALDAKKAPQIVLYSVSWCPHCKEAKEYLTRNNIPFINRDVEVDEKAMEVLTGKYNSNGVPVIVIGTGSNEIVVKGFTPEQFMESLNKAQTKK
ncbi:MAG: NrdH-redoxin [Desulfuromonadales bacterium]|nr:NrdH-redoxin [Desulfuromonadales bacterium]